MLNIKKTKIFTAILSTTLLISGVSTTPVYAKGLSKAVKKEYVKILKKHILKTNEEREAAGYPAYLFKIADINQDGKKDLLFWTRRSLQTPGDTEVYINKNNRISKAKIYYFDSYINRYKTDKYTGLSGTDFRIYKNYIMEVYGRTYGDNSDAEEHCIIDKYDEKENIKQLYFKYKSGGVDDDFNFVRVDKEINEKVQNGRIKKISKKEFDKLAVKFKKVQGKWHQLSTETIKKYVK